MLKRTFSDTPDLYSLDASNTHPPVVATKKTSTHCLMAPGKREGGMQNQLQCNVQAGHGSSIPTGEVYSRGR